MRLLTSLGPMLWKQPAERPTPAKAPPRARRPSRLMRRLQPLGFAAAAIVVGLGGSAWLLHSGLADHALTLGGTRITALGARIGLEVRSVEVEGRRRASAPAVLAALGVARGSAILAVDPAQARERLAALPWIRSASVERLLPDTIRIRLVERQPLAFWQRQGRLSLIDRDGIVVPTEELGAFGNLVVLVGDDAPAHGAALLDLLATEPGLANRVAGAVRVGGRRWDLRFDNGIDVKMPEDDATDAWHRLAEMEKSNGVLERDLLTIDLRLSDRIAVRPVGELPKPAARKSRPTGKST
jgi:cell division protein FtsQ